MKTERFILIGVLGLLSLLVNCGPRERAAVGPTETSSSVLESFRNPPAEYRSAPLWVWNDRMTKDEIEEQLADFKAHGIGGVFIHPRPGLITPYLSEEWLSLWRHAVDVAAKIGLNVWIYDENSYPSGFAGGHVPAAMPDAVRSGLRMTVGPALPRSFDSAPLVVLRKTGSGFEDITAAAMTNGEALGPGEYFVFDLNRQKPNPWYGGYTYVDLMRRDVTDKFLDVTLNAYKRAVGDAFGRIVRGSFEDEAEINPAGGPGMTVVNYTPALFETFARAHGYDLKVHLPSLFDDVGDWRSVRHDFYATLLGLFIDNWAVPYRDYCERNGLVFTGHYWEHEWPRPVVNPDNLAFAAYAHMPGVDILMNDYQTDTHAQFGNARGVKEIRSAANQLGRRRTLSETFGASGWDLTFFDQKRIADWEYALGVNFLNQHLSYVTIMGARKRDHPQSFSYHEPWWPLYSVLADYYGRLSVALSAGEQINRTLILEPTTTAWMYQSPRRERTEMTALGKDFQDFVNALEAAQVEYDLGSEHTLKAFGQVRGATMVIGRRAYDLVVLPPGLGNLESATAARLEAYLRKGGRVVSCVPALGYVDGKESGRVRDLANRYTASWRLASPESWLRDINVWSPPGVLFRKDPAGAGEAERLFHHRRTLNDAELLFLANTSDRTSSSGTILVSGKSCEVWDPFTGGTNPYPSAIADGKLEIAYHVPPGGSVLFCVRPAGRPTAADSPAPRRTVLATAASKVARLTGNVLTLDYCDLTVGGKTEKDLYFYDAQLRTFKAHGLDRNPWDSAVQFKTNILDRDKFAPDSGFEATYRFIAISGFTKFPLPLAVVVERPQLFQVFINGQRVEPLAGRWWLDKAFGEFTGNWTLGENAVTLKAKPFSIHSELEPVYIFGSFVLKAVTSGFVVAPDGEMKLGSWAGQGLPMYGNAVGYTKTVDIPAGRPADARYFVELGAWRGAVAEVRVNGKSAGTIAFAPYRLDITDALANGPNDVAVVVYGTLKNTLGPFHNNPPLGRAWPGSFQQGAKGGRPAGAEYSVVDYGLFEDFALVRIGGAGERAD